MKKILINLIYNNEKNISAEEEKEVEGAWVQGKNANRRGQESFGGQKKKGQKKIDGLDFGEVYKTCHPEFISGSTNCYIELAYKSQIF